MKKRLRFFSISAIVIIFLIYVMQTSFINIPGKEITYINYTVEQGDTLWKIAKVHRTDIDIRKVVWDIKQANGLETSIIHPGDELKVPVRVNMVNSDGTMIAEKE